MKFNFTIFRMIDLLSVFDKFSNADKELGYAIAKTKLNILDVLAEYREKVNDIASKYETIDENGKKSIPSDSYKDYILEMSEYFNNQVEVEIYQVPRGVIKESNYYNPDCKVSEYELLVALFSQQPTLFNEANEEKISAPVNAEEETADASMTEEASTEEAIEENN